MGWQTGDMAALERIRTLQHEELEALGLTAEMAARWRDFYSAIKRLFPRNPSAAGRAALMHRAWRLAVELQATRSFRSNTVSVALMEGFG
jgi:hypothetical protein